MTLLGKPAYYNPPSAAIPMGDSYHFNNYPSPSTNNFQNPMSGQLYNIPVDQVLQFPGLPTAPQIPSIPTLPQIPQQQQPYPSQGGFSSTGPFQQQGTAGGYPVYTMQQPQQGGQDNQGGQAMFGTMPSSQQPFPLQMPQSYQPYPSSQGSQYGAMGPQQPFQSYPTSQGSQYGAMGPQQPFQNQMPQYQGYQNPQGPGGMAQPYGFQMPQQGYSAGQPMGQPYGGMMSGHPSPQGQPFGQMQQQYPAGGQPGPQFQSPSGPYQGMSAGQPGPQYGMPQFGAGNPGGASPPQFLPIQPYSGYQSSSGL